MIKLYATHSNGFECLGSCFGTQDHNRIMRKLVEYGYEMADVPSLERNSAGVVTAVLVPAVKL